MDSPTSLCWTMNGISRQQTRTANGVNEYVSIDPDGPNGSGEAVSMSHDVAGNLTMDPLACNAGQTCGTGVPPAGSGQRYEYDEENRVTAVYNANGTAATGDDVLLAKYEYDALGRRVHTIEYVDAATGAALATPRKTRHVYVGLETVEELDVSSDANGNDVNTIQLREFLWGDSGRFPEPLAMVDWTEAGEQSECIREVVYYLHDVLGSVVGLTNENGELVERYTYDPYGKMYVETTNGQGCWTGGSVSLFGNPWLWTGQRYDAGTGLYAFWFRTYSPSLGRWLQRDRIGYAGGMNLYEYVTGRVLEWTDPLGLEPLHDELIRAIELINLVDPGINTSNEAHIFDIGFAGLGPTIDGLTTSGRASDGTKIRFIFISDRYYRKGINLPSLPQDPALLGEYLKGNPIITTWADILAHEFYHRNDEGTWFGGEPKESWLQELRFLLRLLDLIDGDAFPQVRDDILFRINTAKEGGGISDADACEAAWGKPPPGYTWCRSETGSCVYHQTSSAPK